MSSEKPNFLVFITDQQNASMLSCSGNPWLHTPGMDAIAANGTRFERAYCSNPVCLPSRFSLVTGRPAGETGVRSDKPGDALETMRQAAREWGIGHVLQNAGYTVAFGGKTGWSGGDVDAGFQHLTDDSRDGLAADAARFIHEHRETPFCLFAAFVNPHDVCYMTISEHPESLALFANSTRELASMNAARQPPPGVSREEFFRSHCPPLPPNFEPQEDEPEAVDFALDQRPFKRNARENWSEEAWREHRWTYCRLVEEVDRQIGTVMQALEDSGQLENTIVVLTADHGDHDAAHRLEHKTLFYEEATRIPLLVSSPGLCRPNQVNTEDLVSNGFDLVPTLLDFAGLAPRGELPGKSLRPLLQGTQTEDWRKELPIESELGQMIHFGHAKYIRYDHGKNAEQIADLASDPGEMTNHLDETSMKTIRDRGRQLLSEA